MKRVGPVVWDDPRRSRNATAGHRLHPCRSRRGLPVTRADQCTGRLISCGSSATVRQAHAEQLLCRIRCDRRRGRRTCSQRHNVYRPVIRVASKTRRRTLTDRRGCDCGVTHVRTRLRQVRIDAQTYAWRAEIHHLPGSGDCHRCIRVRVWGAGKTGQAFQADLLSVSWPAPWGACATDDAYPTSADIRTLISYALENGWRPELRGGTFVLSEQDHAAGFSLSGFLLTDRLRGPEGADPTLRVIRAFEDRTQD